MASKKRNSGPPDSALVALLRRYEGDELSQLRLIVNEFMSDIEAVGGLVKRADGWLAIAADDEWTDLADTYYQACRVTQRRPLIADA